MFSANCFQSDQLKENGLSGFFRQREHLDFCQNQGVLFLCPIGERRLYVGLLLRRTSRVVFVLPAPQGPFHRPSVPWHLGGSQNPVWPSAGPNEPVHQERLAG